MSSLNQSRRKRAPRFSVPNREQATILTDGRLVGGTIHKLSLTGGSISLARFFPEGTFAEIRLATKMGAIVSPIEFLRTGVDGVNRAQAFRFIQMHGDDRSRLQTVLVELRDQGYGEHEGGVLRPLWNTLNRAFRAGAR